VNQRNLSTGQREPQARVCEAHRPITTGLRPAEALGGAARHPDGVESGLVTGSPRDLNDDHAIARKEKEWRAPE
jgi:hypothetical protein